MDEHFGVELPQWDQLPLVIMIPAGVAVALAAALAYYVRHRQ